MIYYAYLIILFLSTSLYLTRQLNSLGSVLITFTIALIIPIVIIVKKTNFKFHAKTLVIIYFLGFSGILSALGNNDIKSLISIAVLCLLYFGAFVVFPSLKGFDGSKAVFLCGIFSQLPLILLSFLNGFSTSRYQGIFYNPNSFGTVVATLFVFLAAIWMYHFENNLLKKNKISKIGLFLLSVVLLFDLFLVIVSGSRTSTISCFGVFLYGIGLMVIKLIRIKKIISLIKSVFASAVILFIAYLIFFKTSIYTFLYMNIIYKFEYKAARGDVLDERGLVWQQTVDESRLLGNGSDYFSGTLVGSHNTFISVLGEYGWLMLMFFVLFLLYLLFRTSLFAIRNEVNKYKYLAPMMIICFSLLSVGENMMFKFSMVALFFSSGVIMNNNGFLEKEGIKSKPRTKKIRRKLVWR